MNVTPFLAEVPTGMMLIIACAAAFVFLFFVSVAVYASRYTKSGPNQVLVISGKKRTMIEVDGTKREVGFRIVKGGGRFVWPIFEKVDILSLELLTIDVQTPEVYTSKGVPVKVDGVAQIKVKGDDVSIATAAEQFLSKNVDDIKNIAMQTLEGHCRAASKGEQCASKPGQVCEQRRTLPALRAWRRLERSESRRKARRAGGM